MHRARPALREALHLQRDGQPAVVEHQHRLVVDRVVPARIHAPPVRRGLDHLQNPRVGRVGEVVAQIRVLVVELVGVERTLPAHVRRAVLAPVRGALGLVLRAALDQRAETGHLFADAPAHPPHDQIEVVRALVDEHARAVRLDGPVAAAVGVRRFAVRDLDEHVHAREFADDARLQHLVQTLEERRVAQHVARQHQLAGRDLRRADLLALLPVAPDRLFQKHVVPRLQRLQARGIVKMVRQRDDDGVRLRAGRERVLPALPRRIRRLGGKRGDRVRQPGNLQILGMVRGIRGVGPPADAVAQNQNLYCIIHCLL